MLKNLYRLTFIILIAITVSFSFATKSSAQEESDQKVTVQLISEVDAVQPGAPFWIGLHQTIEAGWHTYWKNSGDSGLPTTIKWDLPENTSAGDIIWPHPSRLTMGPLMNYGYSDQVLLLTKITPPSNLKEGDAFTIRADADWLVCKVICLPEGEELTLTLPVTNNTPVLSEHAEKFRETLDSLPKKVLNQQRLRLTDDRVLLTVAGSDFIPDVEIRDAYFFPENGIIIEHSAPQEIDISNESVAIDAKRASNQNIEELKGVLLLRSDFDTHPFSLSATLEEDQSTTASAPAANDNGPDRLAEEVTPDVQATDIPSLPKSGLSFITAILFALIGGILLNLMPCVFPILSMKALNLVGHAQDEERKEAKTGALFYTLGILVTFGILAGVLITLRSAGETIGWGIQLQSPTFVIFLIYLFVAIGILLTGAAEIGRSFSNIGQSLADKRGHTGSFFTGALAVVVATPCTAPLMGGAIFYALTQPWYISLAVLEALGLGLALPYILIAVSPRILNALPKPGPWMVHFKQFLAFPMFGAAAWLTWVLSQQSGATGVILALSGSLFVAFAIWLFGTLSTTVRRGGWHYFKIAVIIASLIFAGSLTTQLSRSDICSGTPVSASSGEAVYKAFSAQRLEELQQAGEPVFVNMTAAWCITCLANERVALGTEEVESYFKDNNINYLKGDWTNYDEEITAYLEQYDRSGVPIYVYYPPGYAEGTAEAVVLPQLLTPKIVVNTIHKNSPNFTRKD